MESADQDVLSNPRAERVKRVASLATRSGRSRAGTFLVEGPQPVREALRAWLARWSPESADGGEDPLLPPALAPMLDALYFDAELIGRSTDLAALLDQMRGVLFDPQRDLPAQARPFLREASGEVLAAMGDAETSQGILAVCRFPEQSDQDALCRALAPRAGTYLGVGLLRIQDPGNVGTLIRAADAAGADAVVLSPGTVDPWAPKVIRSAAGSHFHLPILGGVEPKELAARARSEGHRLLAADGSADLTLAQLPDHGASTLWLLGNEAHGLSPEEKDLADQLVSIPLYGQAESLNVAMAGTICLYASAMAQETLAQRPERA